VDHVQEAVQALVDDDLAAGRHLGVQVAAVQAGVLVVDVAAGHLDPARTRPVRSDSVFCCFSVTKALAALVVWRLVEAGRVGLDDPVAAHWPGFRAPVTVRQVLAHQGGLHRAPPGIDVDLLTADRAGIEWVAALEPAWEPGTATGYHTLTHGWLLRGLVEAVTGRPFPATFAPGVWCGLPAEVADRAAVVVEAPGSRGLEWIVPNGHVHPAAEAMPPAFEPDWNDPRVRAALQPAFSGWASATALARVFGALAAGGGGMFRSDTVAAMARPVVEAVDVCLDVEVRRSAGFELGGRWEGGAVGALGPRTTAFGHGGHGGQVVVADPEADLAIAVLVNLLPAPQLASERTTVVCELIRGLLDAA